MTLPPLFSYHFPSFVKEFHHNYVDVYWYHQEFSQSRYPPGQEISEACTLICLLVAQKICQTGLLINKVEESSKFNCIMAEAMVEGNATHARIIKEGLISNPYLNIEEALKYGGKSLSLLKEWKFRVFHENIEDTLYSNIRGFLHEWYKQPKSNDLFMLLITCGRTVLFIFQEATCKVTFFDSHGHSSVKNPNRGLVVAQTTIDKLELLCDWFIRNIVNSCYKAQANQYELTFLYPISSTINYHDSSCGCCNY